MGLVEFKLEWGKSLRCWGRGSDVQPDLLDFVRAAARVPDPAFDPPRDRFDWSFDAYDVELWRHFDDSFREGTKACGLLIRSQGEEFTDAATPPRRLETLTIEAYGVAGCQTLRLVLKWVVQSLEIEDATLTLQLDVNPSQREPIIEMFDARFAVHPRS